MDASSIPLFPLATVLCPGGLLPLRIFEPRYVDMVRDCMRDNTGFGVVLIRSGREVGSAAETEMIGTLARIVDWDQGDDGLLAITATGGRRFRILTSEVNPDQLRVGRIDYLPESEPVPTPTQYQPLVEILERVLSHVDAPWSQMETDYHDAAWVANRLTELLPIDNRLKQTQLEQDDPLQSLEYFQAMLDEAAQT